MTFIRFDFKSIFIFNPKVWFLVFYFLRVVIKLDIFQTATTYVEGDKYVSISSVIPIIWGILESYKMSEDNKDEHGFQKCFKETMFASLKNRFYLDQSNVNFKYYQMTTFLDPQYKKHFSRHEAAMVGNYLWVLTVDTS